MPCYGGMTPLPRRMGGAGPNGVRVRVIYDALNRQRGTAYDTTQTSNVAAENVATARVLADVWSTNQRLANQWDASRMTTNLARWEKILGLSPTPSDNDVVRRARVSTVFARSGQTAFTSYLSTQLASLLGTVFVAIEFISYANAVIHVPNGSYPWGTVASGAPWYSTVAHVLIQCKKPTGFSESEFYATVGKVQAFMESVMPAWSTWDWYRPGGISVSVPGGPGAGGFYLDDSPNLDNEVFDV